MKIEFESIKIDVSEAVPLLERYAKLVMQKMQKADKEYAYCWTWCNITFNELQPEFQFGSMEDIEGEEGIYVTLPLETPAND